MKKTMLIAVGALALGTLAQTSSVPQPVTQRPSQVPAAPSATPAAVQEYASGALCRAYNIRWPWFRLDDLNKGLNVVAEQLNSGVVAVDQGYDAASTSFDGRKVNVHNGNLVTWDGYFMAKKSGVYAVILSGNMHDNALAQVTINDVSMAVCRDGTSAREVNLTKGANKISVLTVNKGVPVLEYRLSSSVKPPKKITPAMLSHVVEDEEEW